MTKNRMEKQLEIYYNTSKDYAMQMQSHDDDYFKSYLKLISQYTKDASNLLEVGCSSGASTKTIAMQFPLLQCVGIDISRSEIEKAKIENGLNNLNFEVANVKDLPFRDHSFSIVTSFDCLEHVPALEDALVELMRIVKPGGYLIIKGPNHMSPIYTLIDIIILKYRYPFTHSWVDNFRRLLFEVSHLVWGLTGRYKFLPRVPDLSDKIQTGNDADAVTDMCNLDVYNFFKKSQWKILNVSYPRQTTRVAILISRLLPFLNSMGIVVQKPVI